MLYTFILNYNGFSYARQLEADDLNDAKRRWLETARFGKTELPQSLKEAMAGEKLTRMAKMRNVWISYFTLGQFGATLNVVETAENAEGILTKGGLDSHWDF